MYKLPTKLSNVHLVLVRRQATEGPCALFLLDGSKQKPLSVQGRHNSSQGSSSEGKRGGAGGKLFWGLAGTTVLTGAAVVLAKQNDDVRSWVKDNAPWADNVIAVLYQENVSYGDLSSITSKLSGLTSSVTSSVSSNIFGREEEKPASKLHIEEAPRFKKSKEEKTVPKIATIAAAQQDKEEKIPETVFTSAQLKKEESPSKSSPVQSSESLPQLDLNVDLNLLTASLIDCTGAALEQYNIALNIIRDYNRIVGLIIESSVDSPTSTKFEELKTVQNKRDEALKKADEASKKAERLIEDITSKLGEKDSRVSIEDATALKQQLSARRSQLTIAKQRYLTEKSSTFLADKYWNKVESARQSYLEELQTLFPGVDLSSRRLKSGEGSDLDVLLVYTVRQVTRLQQELAEVQTVRDEKLARALLVNDSNELIQLKVEEESKKEQRRLEREFLKKSIRVEAEHEKHTKEQLKRQIDLHQELLKEKLAQREQQVMKNFEKLLSERVETERLEFKKQLALMSAKLKGVDDALQSRSQADKLARKSQTLWSAGEALLAACKRPQLVSAVKPEINAILKAADEEDELVKTVMAGIPQLVREKGVVTENALRDKYIKMEKTALRVALVPHEGAALPLYLLSWLQSIFLFSQISDIPKKELDNEPTDFSSMDAHEVLQRARYYMERGNISQALRYVNLLQGASRAAASSWLQQAREHLEVRQAAQAVMAHASAAGLLYL